MQRKGAAKALRHLWKEDFRAKDVDPSIVCRKHGL